VTGLELKSREVGQHTDTIHFVSKNSAGNLLAVGGFSNQIKIWRVPEMVIKCELDPVKSGWLGEDEPEFLKWHPQGNLLLVGGGEDGLLWMVNGMNAESKGCLAGHSSKVIQAEFTKHDKGKSIISITIDHEMKGWNPRTGEAIWTIASEK